MSNPITETNNVSPSEALKAFENNLANVKSPEGIQVGDVLPISPFSIDISGRYPLQRYGQNNEEIYAQGQTSWNKAVSGITKGLSLAGTTFVEGTAGLVNGIYSALADGKFSSFYDNELNRELDNINQNLENQFGNYYTQKETDASWYSPNNLLSANFLFDKVIKNLGFAGGMMLTGGVYGAAIKSINAAAKATALGRGVEVLNATEKAIETGKDIKGIYGQIAKFTSPQGGIVNLLDKGRRATVAGLATVGESSFEALQSTNDFRNKLVSQYVEEYGIQPTGYDLDKINDYADEMGNLTFGLNVGLLTATNYIQLPKLLGSSYKSQRGAMSTLPLTKEGDKFIKATGFPKHYTKVKNIGSYLFNTTEAFEEASQFAIQSGAENYYNKKYNNKETDILNDLVGEGYRNVFTTKEGMESLLIGGISGAINPSIIRGNIREQRELNDRTTKALSELNTTGALSFNKFTKETTDSLQRDNTLSLEREKAISQGDFLEAKELEQDLVINYLTPRIKYGRFDVVLDDVRTYRELAATEDGFLNLQEEGIASSEDTKENFLQRLDNFEQTALHMQSKYNSIITKYGPLVNKEGIKIYSDKTIDKMVYSSAKIENYSKRLLELNAKLLEKGVSAIDILERIKNTQPGQENPLKEIFDDIDRLEETVDIKQDIKQDVIDTIELTIRKGRFVKEYDNLVNSPTSEQEQKTEEKKVEEQKTSPSKFPIGRTYSKPIDKLSSLEKLAKKIKTGETDFTEEELQLQSDNTEELERLLKQERDTDSFKLLGKNQAGLYEIEYIGGEKAFLTEEEVSDYQLVKTEEEVVKENKQKNDEIKNEQDNLTNQSVADFGVDDSVDNYPTPEPRKLVQDLFTSTTFSPTSTKDYYKKQQHFLNNLYNYKLINPKAIIVTKNNESSLGLTGLIDYLLEGVNIDKNDDKVTPIVTVFVDSKEDGDYFISPKGERLGKVGDIVDIQNLPVATLPTSSLNFKSTGEIRYRREEEEEAKLFAKSWENKRKELLSTNEGYQSFSFTTSTGFPILTAKDQNGQHKRNFIKGTLSDLSANEMDITISAGEIEFEGQIYSYTAGVPILKTPFGLFYLQNRRLNNKEIDTVFDLLTYYNEVVNNEGFNAQTKRIQNYLNGLIFFGSPKKGKQPSKNQIWFADGMMNFGKEIKIPFTVQSFYDNEQVIKNYLSDMFMLSNNKYLRDNNPFEEILGIDDKGNFESITWNSYKNYLLSDRYDIQDNIELKGTKRNVSDTPLTTFVRKVNKDVEYDYNRNGVYASLNMSLEVDRKPPKKEQPKVASKEVINNTQQTTGFLLDGETTNVLSLGNGNLSFKGKLTNGQLQIEVLKTGIYDVIFDTFAKNTKVVNTIIGQGKANNPFDAVDLLINAKVKQIVSANLKEQPVTQEQVKKAEEPTKVKKKKRGPIDYEDGEYRIVLDNFNYIFANIDKETKYIEDVIGISPNIVKNLIKTTSGGYAMGMFKEGAIYLYDKAEEGTGYHEVFEAVWGMYLDTDEKSKVLSEFRNRKGQFIDRVTGSNISYKESSDYQAKEQLAEEFRQYVLNKKTDVKTSEPKTFIGKIFKALFDFIKNIFTSPSILDDLFKKIDAGKYKTASIINQVNTSEYMEVSKPSITQLYNVTRGFTIEIINQLFSTNESLINFDSPGYTPTKLYSEVYSKFNDLFTADDIEGNIPDLYEQGKINEVQYAQYQKLWDWIQNNQIAVSDSVEEYLRTYGIIAKFDNKTEQEDENNDEYASRNADSYVLDSFTFDFKKNAPKSIKLLLSTLTESKFKDNTKTSVTSDLDRDTYMKKMVDYSNIFNFLLNQLHPLNTLQEKRDKIKQIALTKPNYVRLVNRLKLNVPEEQLTLNDWFIQIKFFNVFSKQKPSGNITFKDEEGSYIQSANLNSAVDSLISSWLSNLKLNSNFVKTNNIGEYVFNGNKLSTIPIKTKLDQIQFLNNLGIEFSEDMYNNLTKSQQSKFANIISHMKRTLSSQENVTDININTLNSANDFRTIAELYIFSLGQSGQSTFFNIEGERIAQFPQSNYISHINNDLNNSKNVTDLFNRKPFLSSKFSSDSIYLNEVLFNESGNRTDFKLELAYNQGIRDNVNNKNLPNSKLTLNQRFLEEVNQNLAANFYFLVPADSKTEWEQKMKHIISFAEIESDKWEDRVYNIFNNYYKTEKSLSENDEGYKSFMYEINGSYDSEELNREKLLLFIKNSVDNTIFNLGIKKNQNDRYNLSSFNSDFISSQKIRKFVNEEEFRNIIRFADVNYMINNIEMHKLYFGDINQISDPLKRWKSFLSPRERALYSSNVFNNKLNEEYNKDLNKSIYGYHEYANDIKTITLKDIIVADPISFDESLNENIRKPYQKNNATDAQSYAYLPAYKEIMIKNGRWNDKFEKLYDYVIARDRQEMWEDGILTDSNYPKSLQNKDRKIINNYVLDNTTFPIIKPIGSGQSNKGLFLDKTSLAPLSYSLVRGTDLSSLLDKMWKQDIGYVIVKSGRKIGGDKEYSLYNKDGGLNKSSLSNIVKVPHEYYGIQVETDKNATTSTLGSQLTKLATVNLRNAGIPIDYNNRDWFNLDEEEKNVSEVYRKIKRNQKALEALQNEGYEQILDKLGIEDSGDTFSVPDKRKVQALLQNQFYSREMPENLKNALSLNELGEFRIPFEAMGSYLQIKQILFSYVDKLIAKPKVNGGQKIQMSGAMFNSKPIELKEVNGKKVLVSTGLKFYSKGKAMEVLLPNWFAKELRKSKELSNLSNEEVVTFINSSPEGEKILTGVGFRIPTQEMNSVDVFKVKGFLPEYMGDTIVVPEALTTKAGSDFDVDKLTTYLKNVYVEGGQIKLIPKFKNKEEVSIWLDKIENTTELANLFSLEVEESINALENFDFNNQDLINSIYKKSLENEYFESLEELILLPQNYERLVKPNDASQLRKMRNMLVDLAPNEFGSTEVKSPLSRDYMTKMRHYFLVGKGGVGIAAVAQTNNALNQAADIFIEPRNINNINSVQKKIISDYGWTIRLPHNQVNGKPSLSLIKDKKGNYISDKISQYIDSFVDISKDPFISQIIQSPNLISTFLFLEKIGVPMETVTLFMNQPIIREYIKLLSEKGTTWLYNEDNVNTILKQFSLSLPSKFDRATFNLNPSIFGKMIENYYKGKSSPVDNANQVVILGEFLKYSVYAQNLFDIVQGTSYDTSASPEPSLQFKKRLKTDNAENNNIISSPSKIFDNTFLGNLQEKVKVASQAISESFFTLLKPQYFKYITNELNELATKHIGNKNYIKYTRNLEQSFLTYLLQTNTGLNTKIKDKLILEETNIANEVRKLQKTLKGTEISNNIILAQLVPLVRKSTSQSKGVTLAKMTTDAFTSDTYTAAFRELRDNPQTAKLYNNLITVGLLQSGLSNSPISYLTYIPFEDYAKEIAPIIDNLGSYTNMDSFSSTGAFQRNNWKVNDIVPVLNDSIDQYGDSKYKMTNLEPFFKLKKEKNIQNFDYSPYKVSTMNRVSNSKFILFRSSEYNPNARRGESKYINKNILLQKVEKNNVPLYTPYFPGADNGYYIYVPVNAWGDGMYTQEFYSSPQQSVLNNDTVKVDEIPMDEIYNAIIGLPIKASNKEQTNINKTKLGFEEGPCK